MDNEQAKKIIIEECISPGGFAFTIRANQVDEEAFSRLLNAVKQISKEVGSNDHIDRLLVACLFELPWGIESTIEHYERQSPKLGSTVFKMAQDLREEIHEMLWTGFESYYDDLF